MNVRARMVEVEGTVIASGDTGVRDAEGELGYISTVAFVDQSGVERTIELNSSETVGDTYTLRYDPTDPTDFSTGGGRWAGLVLGFIGVVFLGIFVRVLVGQRAKP